MHLSWTYSHPVCSQTVSRTEYRCGISAWLKTWTSREITIGAELFSLIYIEISASHPVLHATPCMVPPCFCNTGRGADFKFTGRYRDLNRSGAQKQKIHVQPLLTCGKAHIIGKTRPMVEPPVQVSPATSFSNWRITWWIGSHMHLFITSSREEPGRTRYIVIKSYYFFYSCHHNYKFYLTLQL